MKMAPSVTSARLTADIHASGGSRSFCGAAIAWAGAVTTPMSVELDSLVQHGVRDIHDEIHEDKERAVDDHDAAEEKPVAVEN